jgi:hypothetical protein
MHIYIHRYVYMHINCFVTMERGQITETANKYKTLFGVLQQESDMIKSNMVEMVSKCSVVFRV